jgi:hypothetical protein
MRKHTLYALSCMALMIVVVFNTSINTEAVSTSFSHLNVLNGEKLFDIKTKDNLQGLAYWDGYYYVGYDVGKGFGKIRKYNFHGELIQETDLLAIGHTAELDFRNKNNRLYVANGGGKNPARIFEINMTSKTPYISKTLELDSLGKACLLAIDNENDTLVVHTADNDQTAPKISIIDFNGNVQKHFSIPYQGIPQGLEVHNGIIYFQTNSLISMINLSGQIIGQTAVNESGENEGIAIFSTAKETYYLYGYRFNNRLYKTELYNIHKLARHKD